MKGLQGKIAAVFDKPLKDHGFKKVDCDDSSWGGSRVYRNGSLYVVVSVTMHPRDYPFCCNVELGEGKHEWPDRDWNRIGLWMIVRDSAPEHEQYGIETEADIEEALRKACRDLLEYGIGFLSCDLTRFLELRAQMNAARKPYRVFAPDGKVDSVSRQFVDQSVLLKKKYSKPIAYGCDDADSAESL